MTYIEYIRNYLQRQEPSTPIYIDEIADAMATDYKTDKKKAALATSVAMKRIMDSSMVSDVRCYQKGIYYRTAMTPFGEMGINREKLIAKKYLLPDKGYVTGLHLLYQMGLTTQMPTEKLIATNAAKECIRFDSKLEVSICPPKTLINTENKAYLQTLDALEYLDKAPVDAQYPYLILFDYIKKKGLEYETLLYYADRYYNRKTIIGLAHTASQKGTGG